MKFFLILFIATSIFADFTSAVVASDVISTNCQSESYCQDSDLHQSSSTNQHNESHKNEPCHQGHIHLVIECSEVALTTTSQYLLDANFLSFNVSKIQNYQSNIIRPPIA